jgi:hypothetical protein
VARAGDVHENPKSGKRLVFLRTAADVPELAAGGYHARQPEFSRGA